MEQSPPDPAPFSRALLLAVMVTVLYGAVLVAVFGLVSLALDRDVIGEPDAGPLVGSAMAAVALTVVFLSVLFGLKPHAGIRRMPVGRAVTTGLLGYLLSPLAGAVVYALGQPQLASGIPFYLRYLLSPFVALAALIALVTVLLLPWIDSARSAAR